MSYSDDEIKLDEEMKEEEEIDVPAGILEEDLLDDDILEDDDFLKAEKLAEEDEEDPTMTRDDFV
jgi:hypothetical protein